MVKSRWLKLNSAGCDNYENIVKLVEENNHAEMKVMNGFTYVRFIEAPIRKRKSRRTRLSLLRKQYEHNEPNDDARLYCAIVLK